MLSIETLAARRSGLGGSDIGAVLGLSPYRTPLDVYLEKVGEVAPADLSGNEAVHFGNVLEDVVADEFSRRTGLSVRRNNRMLQHPSVPFLLANIDREVVGKVGGLKAGLECKTAGAWSASPDLWGRGELAFRNFDGEFEIIESDDRVPVPYLMQCVHYMAVTGADLWFLAVLIGGNDFRIFVIRRDLELEKELIRRATNFWELNVEMRLPPPASNPAELEKLYPRDNGAFVVADDAAIDLVAEIKALSVEEKALSSRLAEMKDQLRTVIGENAELLVSDGGAVLASWKSQDSSRLDSAALKKAHPGIASEFSKTTTSRVLRIK